MSDLADERVRVEEVTFGYPHTFKVWVDGKCVYESHRDDAAIERANAERRARSAGHGMTTHTGFTYCPHMDFAMRTVVIRADGTDVVCTSLDELARAHEERE